MAVNQGIHRAADAAHREAERHAVKRGPDPQFGVPRMFRSRKLLDLAHRFDQCQNCYAHTPEGCEPAHSNMPEHGKGVSLKSHDVYFAALCPSCHRWLDNRGGNGGDPSGRYPHTAFDKSLMWRRAADRTLLEIWRRGWVRVA